MTDFDRWTMARIPASSGSLSSIRSGATMAARREIEALGALSRVDWRRLVNWDKCLRSWRDHPTFWAVRILATSSFCRLLVLFMMGASHGFSAEAEVSFARDVMAVLSKAGCNGGGCHGNQNGKGDLKLSLWGERPIDDLESLLKNPKHVNRDDPAASHILQKPTLQLNHEGEKRFGVDSPEYEVLRRWISAGAPGIPDGAPVVESIEVSPASAILSLPENSEQLRVVARFSDGEIRDVTRWATYETSQLIAEVDQAGLLEFAQPGETAVFVRYLDGRASMRAALIEPAADYEWSDQPPPTASIGTCSPNCRISASCLL